MKTYALVFLAALAAALSAGAEPTSFVPYSNDAGLAYQLPSNWEVIEQDQIADHERQGRNAMKSDMTSREAQWLDQSRKLLAIQKRGNEAGGALMSVTVDFIPPSDQITAEEVRHFSPIERAQMESILDATGRSMAKRFEDLYGTRESKLVSSSIEDFGNLTCFVMEFSGTLTSGLSPRQLQYNCPDGPVALVVLVTYNRDLHSEVWPEIMQVMQSLEFKEIHN